MSWWPNRKSRMGLRAVVAKAPPKLPDGREWWTTPPTALPEPAHIEYVVEFQRATMDTRQGPDRDAMLRRVRDWLTAARRLCHERMIYEHGEPVGLRSTDDLLMECKSVVGYLAARLTDHGVDAWGESRVRRLCDELTAREAEILRRRAESPAHPVKRLP
jgi:hypothetical protein